MAQTKATKKFEKKHLKDTIKRRKDFAKIKQRHQLKAKQKARKAEDRAAQENDADGDEASRPAKRKKQEQDELNNMTVDDFFAKEFQVPSDIIKKPKSSKPSSSANAKRKAQAKDDDDSLSDESFAENGALEDSASDNSEDDGLDAAGAHKGQLKALQSKDPEFYKYLQENDAELLDFDEDANLAEIDELSESDQDDSLKKSGKKEAREDDLEDTKTGSSVSSDMVNKWTAAMTTQHSLRSMREIVLAFRAAAHLNEEDGKNYKYIISSASVYHEVLVSALRYVPEVLSHHLPAKKLADGKIRVATDSKKYRTLTTLLKSHTMSMQHLLQNLSDPATLKLTLSSMLEILPYILSFKKAIRELTRAVVDVWSEVSHSEATRISAFLVLRRLIVIGDEGVRQTVLRTTYQGLIKGCRVTTIYNLASINLTKNSAAELWGLAESNASYTSAFTFIRQLAIHLRNSIKNNANDSYKTVYNWQYVHSLDFWSRVLSTQCDSLREATNGKESPLRPLIYPLTQVTLGAMRLIPTAAYFPLRFQLIRALIRVSRSTNTFIPLATPLYEVLTSTEMKKPPKASTLKPVDFDASIRVAKSYLRTRVYQDGVGEQVAELLAEVFNLWAKNIAFPELALPVVVMLKRWLKEVAPFVGARGATQQSSSGSSAHYRKGKKIKGSKADAAAGGNRNGKVNGMISLLVQKLDANARFVEERRAKVDFAPNDRAGVEGFLKELEWNETPLGAFVEGQRKQREERQKILEEGRREEETKRQKQREEKEKERDDEGFGGDSEEEEEDDDDDNKQEREDELVDEDEEELEDEFEDEEEMEDDLED